jgi:hypothetical protein
LLVQLFGWHVPAWPSGELYFNPLAWQVLFVFGAWYAYEGAGRLRKIVQSPAALILALLYLAFGLAVALSWQLKALEGMMPDWLSALIYPIDKSHLSSLRLLHFLALAIVVSRLTPPDWYTCASPIPSTDPKHRRRQLAFGQMTKTIAMLTCPTASKANSITGPKIFFDFKPIQICNQRFYNVFCSTSSRAYRNPTGIGKSWKLACVYRTK